MQKLRVTLTWLFFTCLKHLWVGMDRWKLNEMDRKNHRPLKRWNASFIKPNEEVEEMWPQFHLPVSSRYGDVAWNSSSTWITLMVHLSKTQWGRPSRDLMERSTCRGIEQHLPGRNPQDVFGDPYLVRWWGDGRLWCNWWGSTSHISKAPRRIGQVFCACVELPRPWELHSGNLKYSGCGTGTFYYAHDVWRSWNDIQGGAFTDTSNLPAAIPTPRLLPCEVSASLCPGGKM